MKTCIVTKADTIIDPLVYFLAFNLGIMVQFAVGLTSKLKVKIVVL